MKKKKNLTLKLVFAVVLIVFAMAVQPAHAQINFDDDVDDEVPAAPIDGLLGLGIAAGAWYGMQKLRKRND